MKKADCPYCGFYGHQVTGNTYKCERCGAFFKSKAGFIRLSHIDFAF